MSTACLVLVLFVLSFCDYTAMLPVKKTNDYTAML